MKTGYKQAVEAFTDSDEWEKLGDPVSLRAPAEMRQYLLNRLLTAFAAGWNAHGEETARRLSDNGNETQVKP